MGDRGYIRVTVQEYEGQNSIYNYYVHWGGYPGELFSRCYNRMLQERESKAYRYAACNHLPLILAAEMLEVNGRMWTGEGSTLADHPYLNVTIQIGGEIHVQEIDQCIESKTFKVYEELIWEGSADDYCNIRLPAYHRQDDDQYDNYWETIWQH